MQRMPCTLSFKGFTEKHRNHIQITWVLGWMLICNKFQQPNRAQVPQTPCFCSGNNPDHPLQSMILAGKKNCSAVSDCQFADGVNFDPVNHRNLWQDLDRGSKMPPKHSSQPGISSQIKPLSLPMDHCCWLSIPTNPVQPVESECAYMYVYIYVYIYISVYIYIHMYSIYTRCYIYIYTRYYVYI